MNRTTPMPPLRPFTPALAALALGLAACSQMGSGVVPHSAVLPDAMAHAHTAAVGTYIKHVVVIIQENRTFDNLFEGYPGANTSKTGKNSKGQTVTLKAITFDPEQDMVHNYTNAVVAWNHGKMNAFDLDRFDDGDLVGNYPYAFVERSQVAPYWAMAKAYTLADHMFPTEFGPSFTSHLSLIAGTMNLSPTLAEANYPTSGPWGCDAPPNTSTDTVNPKRVVSIYGPFPCFTQFTTMADTLDAKKVSWKYYAPQLDSDPGGQLWTSFDAIHNVRYGPDWTRNISSPNTNVLKDAAAGKLAGMSWVIPDWLYSDHPAASSDMGPSWVSSVVNAIGKSKDWNSTAIIIVWDDWGGWYDNVKPPQHDFRGNGIRVGCLIISPYARKGYVSHTVYEFGSILKFVEQAFDLKPLGATNLGYTDTRATSLVDSFDFTQKPRAFTPIPAKYPADFFLKMRPSYRAPDNE
jgi:phospholipase C